MLPDPYYSDALVTLYHGRAEDVLPELAGAGVDLVFTSPPYNLGVNPGGSFGHWADGGTRGGMGKWNPGESTSVVIDYDGHDDAMPYPEYVAWQHQVLNGCWAALSDTGAIYYNHKPRVQAGGLLLPLELNPGLPLRQIITWDRCSGPNFVPTNYQPRYEWIMVLAKQGWRLKDRSSSGIGDVWRVPADRSSRHPAPFPLELPRRAITTTDPALVLDPFSGAGTTVCAAKRAGVRAIGIEVSEAYCALAAARCGSAEHTEALDGEGSLFTKEAL